jgi:hypothetical protein
VSREDEAFREEYERTAAEVKKLTRLGLEQWERAALAEERVGELEEELREILDLTTGWCSDKLTAEERLAAIGRIAKRVFGIDNYIADDPSLD